VERAVVLAQGGLIGPEHLLLSDNASAREQILDGALSRLIGGTESMPTILASLRRRLIALALERTHGDHAAAARMLGVDTIELGEQASS
jgi:DNA-binding NtrC family response regulator